MALSTNSLIHFTKQKNFLKGILSENFKVKFCLESILTPKGSFEFAIPMVSFCDIPLSEIKSHIDKYGCYGIGLNRSWGQSKKLNPVLYIDKYSSLSENYYQVYEEFLKDTPVSKVTKSQANLIDIIRYMKNYQSDLNRKNKIIKNYKFADEKEWRYVPSFTEARVVVSKKIFSQDNNKSILNREVNKLKLDFSPGDINYIIIKKESEISEFIDVLRKSKGTNYSLHDIERLMTRIITTEQIFSDF